MSGSRWPEQSTGSVTRIPARAPQRQVAQVNVALEVTYDLVRFLSSLFLRGFPFQRTVVSRRRDPHSSACSFPLALSFRTSRRRNGGTRNDACPRWPLLVQRHDDYDVPCLVRRGLVLSFAAFSAWGGGLVWHFNFFSSPFPPCCVFN